MVLTDEEAKKFMIYGYRYWILPFWISMRIILRRTRFLCRRPWRVRIVSELQARFEPGSTVAKGIFFFVRYDIT